jgi:hypothetical protein
VDEFVARENVHRFEDLLARATDKTERERLTALLAEARARLDEAQRRKWTGEARRTPKFPARDGG